MKLKMDPMTQFRVEQRLGNVITPEIPTMLWLRSFLGPRVDFAQCVEYDTETHEAEVTFHHVGEDGKLITEIVQIPDTEEFEERRKTTRETFVQVPEPPSDVLEAWSAIASEGTSGA